MRLTWLQVLILPLAGWVKLFFLKKKGEEKEKEEEKENKEKRKKKKNIYL